MPQVVKGADVVDQGYSSKTWSKTEGWRSSHVFTGTKDAIDRYIPLAVAAFNPDSLTVDAEDEGVAKLTLFFGNDNPQAEIPETTWELLSNDLEKDNLQHINTLAFPPKVLDAVVFAVQKYEARSEQNPYTLEQGENAITAACNLENPIFNSYLPLLLFDLRSRSQDSFSVDQTVLRKTQVVSSNYPQKLAFIGVGELWLTNDIHTLEGIPNGIQFDILQIPSPIPREGFLFSWLKKRPTAVVISQNKVKLEQEWWLEQWSLFDYNAYNNP